jgi:photosystem II stability/assembly factor-like uncharacterized protein
MKSTLLKILTLAGLALLTSGCVLFPVTSNKAATSKADGGVWRSADGGKTFAQAGDVLTVKGKVSTINNLGILKLTLDPSDSATIYGATEANGLIYSLDGGNSWSQFEALKQGYVRAVAVDPFNKCVVFVLIDNKLYKTENCGRDFTNIYYHQKATVILTALAVDHKNSKIVYVGTSEGEILKSTDGGNTWLTVRRQAGDKIIDILVDLSNNRIIYVGTTKSGILKSLDAGQNWTSLGAGLASYVGSHEYKQLIPDPATPNGLIFISKFGLLRTVDGGDSWQVIELLPNAKKTSILAVAVNPKSSAEFYYATASSLVKTSDGGVKWSSKKMPFSTRLTTGIFISSENPNIVYLTTAPIKK